MTTAVASLPEQGQLVSVRSRQWVVNDVRPSTLPPPALKPAFSGPQHLLTLSSVENDGLGEELQVIWEIEPEAKVIERVALPEPTGGNRKGSGWRGVRWRWRPARWPTGLSPSCSPSSRRAPSPSARR